ncbi:anti-sigma factor [Pontibacillus yanchengensis]|uniref:Anti-sigma factor n=2 Tax=Pontibacillus yanchengensis TaxID=462910 RepID=A0ACC7VK24_9BACI|nr:anti-sigma factor [Pontibacillus yanchengensis]MYL34953.1 anti-sigma factor [Pontibacillus yanchengensis]MYL55316.1 anti-sigma factor [Pontibacillus yanchengensis]
MKCSTEAVALMHKYLDDELTKDEEKTLRNHLHKCEECQRHFHELKRTIAMVQSTNQVQAPQGFSENVMKNLPSEKKSYSYKRWFKAHPMITAAAIFFILMFGSVFSMWNQDQHLSVSKQKDIIIQDNTVIVPEGKIVEGDLVVKNGNLRIDGKVNGDVVLINGDNLKASAGEVTGELSQVNQVFDWIWYKMKTTVKDVFSMNEEK